SETVGGTLVGVGLFFLSVYVLFTNEGRALKTASILDEGLSLVVSLGLYPSLDLQNNNRLVHLSAQLRTSQPLHDPSYGVVVQAVKLKREVEMYQWVEHQESKDYQENGETKTETTYTYNTEWKLELVNSRNFDKEIGHQNPSAMAVQSVTVVFPEVRAGPFILSKGICLNNDINTQPIIEPLFVNVSIVAMQRGEQLMPFKTKSGDTLEILYLEELSAEEVFAREHQHNNMKTWGLRAAGWALMFLSIQLMTRIIYTLVDWVPILRQLVSVGLKIFALCVSCSLSLLTIGIGWLFYRPLVAAGLGALALLPWFLTRPGLLAKKKE
uniref:Transmembrane protein 43 n=1 Tax=Monopterus albus TaxID=43700 RepID=A0A3Q3R640_MONAL